MTRRSKPAWTTFGRGAPGQGPGRHPLHHAPGTNVAAVRHRTWQSGLPMTACPTFGSWEEFHAYRFEEPRWRPLVYEVLDRHGIARPSSASDDFPRARGGDRRTSRGQAVPAAVGWRLVGRRDRCPAAARPARAARARASTA